MHVATLQNNSEAIRLLTQSTFWPSFKWDLVDQKGNTVLHNAVLSGKFRIFELVVAHCTAKNILNATNQVKVASII